MKNFYLIPLFLFMAINLCIAKDDCYKLEGKITPSSKNLYMLKTSLEGVNSELNNCQELVNEDFKNSIKFKNRNLSFPVVIETNKGQLSARCNCEKIINSGADSVDEIKYQFQMAECYSKAISKVKLASSVDLTKICWDGKFPIGGMTDLERASELIKNQNTSDFTR